MNSSNECLMIHVPRWNPTRREIMVMPLGFPSLANLIRDEIGVEPTLMHLGIEYEVNPDFSMRSWLDAHPPRQVFLSLHWHQQTRSVINLARKIRSWLPETKIILGGLTASVFARPIMEQLRFIDAVVQGDGEEPILALVRSLDNHRLSNSWNANNSTLHEIPNLCWRDDKGGLHANPRRYHLDMMTAGKLRHGSLQFLRHRKAYLERVLYADFSQGAQEKGQPRTAYLNAGRGCTVDCATCGGGAKAQSITRGKKGLLLYPLPKLMRDVKEASSEGANLLRMSFDPPGARTLLCNWFHALAEMGTSLRLVYDLWHLPSTNLLDSMSRTFEKGSTLVLSPECGSENVRRRIRGLSFSNDELLRSIQEVESRGFHAHCFFSGGLPTESPDDVKASIALIHRIQAQTEAGISVCPMVLDPASPIHRNPDAFDLTLTRKTLQDFYEEKGIADGPGYETRWYSEQEILEVCNCLLNAAGLPRLDQN
jgi:radical SAM superfamily enzyme YgiQ (UPF0313 family)